MTRRLVMARADELVCSRNLHFFRPSQPMFRSCSFNCFAGSDLNVTAQGRCFQLGLASEKHGEWRCESVVNIADLTFVWSSFCICILIICSLATEREKNQSLESNCCQFCLFGNRIQRLCATEFPWHLRVMYRAWLCSQWPFARLAWELFFGLVEHLGTLRSTKAFSSVVDELVCKKIVQKLGINDF